MPLQSVISIIFELLNTEQLRDLRGTSRELCAVVSDDHGWFLKYREMVDGFELSKNEKLVPIYPLRERGERNAKNHFLPVEADLAGFVLPPYYGGFSPRPLRMENGVLEDVLYSAIEPIRTRTKIYKARPLPLHCICCNVECDSYVSFTEHCTLRSHKKKLDPYTRFDPRFTQERYNDPRHNAGFDELSMMMKCRAMDHYKFHMKCFFLLSKPLHKRMKAPIEKFCQRGAWKNMKECSSLARGQLMYDNDRDNDIHGGSDSDDFHGMEWGLTEEELQAIIDKCPTERAVDVWLGMIFEDFEGGLQGVALKVVQRGWISLDMDDDVEEKFRFMAGMTGLDY